MCTLRCDFFLKRNIFVFKDTEICSSLRFLAKRGRLLKILTTGNQPYHLKSQYCENLHSVFNIHLARFETTKYTLGLEM